MPPSDDARDPHDEPVPEVEQRRPKRTSVGLPAIAVLTERTVEQMGVVRTGRTLARLNQPHGFDCMGCAWPDPDPDHRSVAEFCENGAKAVAEEATRTPCSRSRAAG